MRLFTVLLILGAVLFCATPAIAAEDAGHGEETAAADDQGKGQWGIFGIAIAAGIFKPLISGTIRAVTDKSNKTLGFGIFYAMVNVGASIGPIVAGKLRVISWNYAFLAAAIGIVLMLLITIFFYKEPERQMEGATLAKKFKDMGTALSDIKFGKFFALAD